MKKLTILIAALAGFSLNAALAQELPPPPAEPKDFTLPPMETMSFDNGLKVTFVPFGAVPKVTIAAVVKTGNLDEGDQTWLADLTGEMMKQGTAKAGGAELALWAAEIGGDFTVTVGADQTVISIDALSEFSASATHLIGQVLMHPTLPESEFDRIKSDFLRDLSVTLSQPQPLANLAFSEMIYGDHPYGHPYPAPDLLQSYSLQNVRDFYNANFGAARTHLFVIGRFESGRIMRAIEEAYLDWPAGPQGLKNPPAPKAQMRVKLIDRPGAPQSTLYLGLPVPAVSAEGRPALELTHTLLGGAFSSRITSNIREDKGYTYSPRATLNDYVGASHWVEIADVTTEATGPALTEIFAEIDRLQATAPDAAEITGFKNYMAGIFVLRSASRGGLLDQLATLDRHGRPLADMENYVGAIKAVTPAAVSEAANSYLRDQDMTLVVVGDLTEITDQLKALPQLQELEFEVADSAD